MQYYTRFDSKLWEIIIVGDDSGITHLHMETGRGKREFHISDEWQRDDARFSQGKAQILEYFDGKRSHFDLKLVPQGTEFQKRVWQLLQKIPYGETSTYGELAAKLGNPKASRAVGAANGQNPIPIIIPCHRVVGANGKLTGFAHGLGAKEKLLTLEQVNQ